MSSEPRPPHALSPSEAFPTRGPVSYTLNLSSPNADASVLSSVGPYLHGSPTGHGVVMLDLLALRGELQRARFRICNHLGYR